MRAAIKITFTILSAVLALAMLGVIPFNAFTDRAFVCENTGSRLFYREWFNGATNRVSHEKSAVETYLQARYPGQPVNRWKGYASSEHNIYGMRIARACGRIGDAGNFPVSYLNEYFPKLNEADKRRFCNALASGTAKVDDLNEILDPESAAARSQEKPSE